METTDESRCLPTRSNGAEAKVDRPLRVGMIVPPTNSVNEAEWRSVLPAKVRLRLTRMALHEDAGTEAGRERLYDDLRERIPILSRAGIDVLAYCCTAGSMVNPLDRLAAFMSSLAGVPAVATAPALVHACRSLGVVRVALATPYHDALNAHEVAFLEGNDIAVCAVEGLGIGAGGPHEYAQIARVPEKAILDHIRSVDRADADGVIVSCTDFPALGLVARLEEELGKPVITSNSATLWAVLRAAGRVEAVGGIGRLGSA